jgi:hypothetical protein
LFVQGKANPAVDSGGNVSGEEDENRGDRRRKEDRRSPQRRKGIASFSFNWRALPPAGISLLIFSILAAVEPSPPIAPRADGIRDRTTSD